MKHLSRRLDRLEKSFAAELPEDPGQAAMDRTIKQAPYEVLKTLYEAVVRVYGPAPSSGPDRIELAELWPELTPIEAEAVEELVRIAESL